jgi:GNAT superfamily N-acetyltransferase
MNKPVAPGEIFSMRVACRLDIPALLRMQHRSLTVLGADFYSREEIAAFEDLAGTMDEHVVDEGHYFVAVSTSDRILASGGWSRRAPGYDRARLRGPADAPDPGGATVRSVFVDPALARRGIGSALMAHVEQDAARSGMRSLQLTATLSGRAFYERLGWRTQGEKSIALPGGLRFRCVSMRKSVE